MFGFTASTGGLSNAQSFCGSSLFYSSYLNGLAVQEPAPWVGCVGGDADFTTQALAPSVNAIWDASGDAVLAPTTTGIYAMTGFNADGCPTHGQFDVEVLDPALQLGGDAELGICGETEPPWKPRLPRRPPSHGTGLKGQPLSQRCPGCTR